MAYWTLLDVASLLTCHIRVFLPSLGTDNTDTVTVHRVVCGHWPRRTYHPLYVSRKPPSRLGPTPVRTHNPSLFE